MTSSLLFDQFISHIQEIIYIEWLFELICMFFLVFLSSLQIIKKRGNNTKTGESSKLWLYYCAIVKYICLFFDQLTSYLPNQVARWPFIVLESMVPLIAWHSAQTYPTHWLHLYCLPVALWAQRDQKKRHNLGQSSATQSLSYGH